MDKTYVYRQKPINELKTSTNDEKKYMIFTKRGVYSYVCADYVSALWNHMLQTLPTDSVSRVIRKTFFKFDFPEELDKVINLYNGLLQSDYDSVLYFVALDEGVAWKNPNKSLFEKDVKYYNPLHEEEPNKLCEMPRTLGVDMFFREDWNYNKEE